MGAAGSCSRWGLQPGSPPQPLSTRGFEHPAFPGSSRGPRHVPGQPAGANRADGATFPECVWGRFSPSVRVNGAIVNGLSLGIPGSELSGREATSARSTQADPDYLRRSAQLDVERASDSYLRSGLNLHHLSGSVGDERVVVPGREQRQLAAWGGSDPPNDQPHGDGVLAGEHRGHLRVHGTSPRCCGSATRSASACSHSWTSRRQGPSRSCAAARRPRCGPAKAAAPESCSPRSSRGSTTLPLRLQRRCENAEAVADFLNADARVVHVSYPGHCPATASTPWRSRSSTAASVESCRSPSAAPTGPARVRQRPTAHPVGRLVRPRRDSRGLRGVPRASAAAFAEPFREYGLARLAIGLEAIDDLLADLDDSLTTAYGPRTRCSRSAAHSPPGRRRSAGRDGTATSRSRC